MGQPPKKNGGTVTIKLAPGATAAGRLVGPDGKPLGGVRLELSFRPKGWGGWHDYWPSRVTTDRDGRFRVGGLLPGHEFRLGGEPGEVRFGTGLQSGRTTDLGDVRLQRSPD
jgi:hypothetical protein